MTVKPVEAGAEEYELSGGGGDVEEQLVVLHVEQEEGPGEERCVGVLRQPLTPDVAQTQQERHLFCFAFLPTAGHGGVWEG